MEKLARIPDELLSAPGTAEQILDPFVQIPVCGLRRRRHAAHRIFGDYVSHTAMIMQRVGFRHRVRPNLPSFFHVHATNAHSPRAYVHHNRIASLNRETRQKEEPIKTIPWDSTSPE
jgi:hypothetical protein